MTNNQETNTTDVEKAFECDEGIKHIYNLKRSIRSGYYLEAETRDGLIAYKAGFAAGARSRDKEIEQLKDQLREAVKVLGSFDEYRSASDRGETSKTQWHTFERILYDRTRQFLTKHQLKSEEL